jgi:large subunit ribosomal protein L24
MKIKKGDKVKMLTGKDNGKTGKVLQVLPGQNKVSIEGLNILIKHMRPQRQGESGQRIEFPSFVNASNVALVCPKCSKTARVGYKMLEGGEGKKAKKVRVCKKCNEILE